MRRPILLSIASAMCIVSLAAAETGVGVNYGFMFPQHDQRQDEAVVVSLPGSPLDGVTSMPGFRLAVRTASGHQLYLDTSIFLSSYSGHATASVQALGNYQYDFQPRALASPYVTAGGGLYHFDNGDLGPPVTQAIAGGGLGIRRRVAAGHGDFRLEARYDHYFPSHEELSIANSFATKFGFDLWMGK